MNKRDFLNAAGASATLLASGVADAAPRKSNAAGPGLLTVTGAISSPNRGALNHSLDQMMHKQHLEFDKARVFDFAALTALPAVSIHPTLEYDGKQHVLRGPLLLDVMQAAGADRKAANFLLRAIDGYAVLAPRADIERYRFIIATHMDGQPLALGGLGPLWAVYEADRYADMRDKPLTARFGLCPWGLYHIAVSV
ncbi:molybdopterin-dependent oxidoreductase [Herbaspirillum lusitanum]|uniref:Molybdopterin-dependent oxidoreductase n=1 Tax=Herbaspirillum lusitanum TaxID=213312 RepID=A0ABW9A6G9_9BURK